MSVQHNEGDGTLIDSHGAETPVHYTLGLRQEVVHQPGLPPALGRAHSRGTIAAAPGVHFPDGFYRLRTADGQALRMQRLFPEWYILASR